MKNIDLKSYFYNAIDASINALNNDVMRIIDYYSEPSECSIDNYFASQILDGKLFDSTDEFSDELFLCNIDDFSDEFENQRQKAFDEWFENLIEDTDENQLIDVSDNVVIDNEEIVWLSGFQSDMMDMEMNTFGDSLFEKIFSLMGESKPGQNVRKAAILSGAKYIYINNETDNYTIYFWKERLLHEKFEARKTEILEATLSVFSKAICGNGGMFTSNVGLFVKNIDAKEIEVYYFNFVGNQYHSDNTFMICKSEHVAKFNDEDPENVDSSEFENEILEAIENHILNLKID
jgi:hypothetical protein